MSTAPRVGIYQIGEDPQVTYMRDLLIQAGHYKTQDSGQAEIILLSDPEAIPADFPDNPSRIIIYLPAWKQSDWCENNFNNIEEKISGTCVILIMMGKQIYATALDEYAWAVAKILEQDIRVGSRKDTNPPFVSFFDNTKAKELAQVLFHLSEAERIMGSIMKEDYDY